VGEVVWRQRRSDLALPRERGAPEQEAGALLWRIVCRAGLPVRYEDRSFALAINDAIVAGKSAVIAGPISFVCSSGPSISTS
jgi:hypothetical protein